MSIPTVSRRPGWFSYFRTAGLIMFLVVATNPGIVGFAQEGVPSLTML